MSLKSNRKLKWGLASTGRMSSLFTQELHKINSLVTAVSSRDHNEARKFAQSHDINYCYDSVVEMIKDSKIDILYISNPNHLHIPYSQLAQDYGVHVLCEKPAALNPLELKELLNKQSNNLWFEGFLYRTHPIYHQLVQEIQQGKWGKVLSIQGQFGIDFPYNPHEFRYNKSMGGGALMDLGVYGVSFAAWVLGWHLEVREIHKNLIHNVDTHCQFRFDSKLQIPFEFTCSFDQVLPPQISIQTDQGILTIDSPWMPDSQECHIQFEAKDRGTTIIHQGSGDIAWGREALHVEHLIEQGLIESPYFTHQDSQDLAELMSLL